MFLLFKNHVYLNKQNVLYNVHIDESGYIEKSEKMCIISSVNNTHNIHNVRCVILCIKWCIYGAYYGEMCMTYSVQRSAYIDKSGDGSVCALLLEVITGHSGAQPNILIPSIYNHQYWYRQYWYQYFQPNILIIPSIHNHQYWYWNYWHQYFQPNIPSIYNHQYWYRKYWI